MISFIIPTWLAIFIGITAAIWLVSALRNIYQMWMYTRVTKWAVRQLEDIKEATKDPKLTKSCAYAIYQIGKSFAEQHKQNQ